MNGAQAIVRTLVEYQVAFASQGPVFLDIVSQPEMADLPPVFSWLRKTGRDPLAGGR